MATIAQSVSREERFYQKMALGLAIFIVFGFAQFAARGFVDYGGVPIIFHIHGLVMISWLSVLVVQTTLVARDNLAAHRKLGWLGAARRRRSRRWQLRPAWLQSAQVLSRRSLPRPISWPWSALKGWSLPRWCGARLRCGGGLIGIAA